MHFPPEVYVVLDELLTEVLRCQQDSQDTVIETLLVDISNLSCTPTTFEVYRDLSRRIVARSPLLKDRYHSALYADFDATEVVSRKSMQSPIFRDVAMRLYYQLVKHSPNVTEALTQAAKHSRQRTHNTDYRRVFKVFVSTLHSQGGVITESLLKEIGGKNFGISDAVIVKDLTAQQETPSQPALIKSEVVPPPEPVKPEVQTRTPKASSKRNQIPLPRGAHLQRKSEIAEEVEDADTIAFLEDWLKESQPLRFEDVKSIFDGYPFVTTKLVRGKLYLAVGNSSFSRDGENYTFQSCAITYWDEQGHDAGENSFANLTGVFGTHEDRECATPGNKRQVKLLPLTVGMSVRYWTHCKPEKGGDTYKGTYLVDDQFKLRSYPNARELTAAKQALRRKLLAKGALSQKRK